MLVRGHVSGHWIGVIGVNRIDDGYRVVPLPLQAARQVDVERVLHRARDFRARIGGLHDEQVALREVVRSAWRRAGDGRVARVQQLHDHALVMILEQVADGVQPAAEWTISGVGLRKASVVWLMSR